ncbi:hypothetical protein RJ639_044751 [Escallonia herrerae]|uniref:FAF domain-containing protein n=1 Tax=Escallonia herrerae TaxID=1293975 RepID=A0AA88WB83_9ASTE|nr:hypothetical protein RJ639_044751 [Escallonia herrerae]
MAACGGLQHIFDKPLPGNPTLLESLSSWKHIKSMKSLDESSFTEIFGELHCKENPDSVSSSPLPLSTSSSLSSSPGIEKLINKDKNDAPKNSKSTVSGYYPSNQKKYRHSDSFSSMNSDSLSMCTEGLGFESSDDVEDLKNDISIDWQHHEERTSSATKHMSTEVFSGETKRSRTSGGKFPPPISCIGRSGKPWVCFKSYRHSGRFILKQVRIPTQEFLHACREDGRLKLQFIQSDDEIPEGGEEEEDDDEENKEKGDDDHDHVLVENGEEED